MANKKITDLDPLTTPAGADILAIVDDVAGTATTKKVTVTNLMGQASASNLSSYDFDGNAISNFDASINDQTGTTYTVTAGDNGKVVVLDNASAITVTVPSGLGAGFNCSFVQKGAGQVSFATSSTTINNRQSHTKINAQYGVASIVAYAADTFVLAGDTVA
jgi:hypothetical protein